jgi:hypothetical protein
MKKSKLIGLIKFSCYGSDAFILENQFEVDVVYFLKPYGVFIFDDDTEAYSYKEMNSILKDKWKSKYKSGELMTYFNLSESDIEVSLTPKFK